jgi:hypothetical protein
MLVGFTIKKHTTQLIPRLTHQSIVMTYLEMLHVGHAISGRHEDVLRRIASMENVCIDEIHTVRHVVKRVMIGAAVNALYLALEYGLLDEVRVSRSGNIIRKKSVILLVR